MDKLLNMGSSFREYIGAKGVLHLAVIFGIPIRVHWTFSLLLLWIGYEGWVDGLAWTDIAIYILFVLCLFICVILHELGHSLAARYYGVKTQDITISPIGGVARLMNIPDVPKQEFVIAVAGPLVNVLIALTLAVVISVFLPNYVEYIFSIDETHIIAILPDFLINLLKINLTLVVFNMIPAFPMDGGRVVRSLLSIKLGRLRATLFASFLGRFIAMLFCIYGIYAQQYTLIFIGLFVFFMASYEYKYVKIQEERKLMLPYDDSFLGINDAGLDDI